MLTPAADQCRSWFHRTTRVRARRVARAGHAGALLFLMVWFRVGQLGTLPGLNGDEAWYGVQAERLLAGEAFAWSTPTGSPLNPFFFLPQVALHALGEPSALRLRIPAVVSGLLALAVHAVLARRRWGTATAVYSTVLLAVLPVNLAYSRFAWDASQTVLAITVFVHCVLGLLRNTSEVSLKAELPPGLMILGLLAFLAALWVHPTNIFLLPMALAAATYAAGPNLRYQLGQVLESRRGRVAAGMLLLVGLSAAWVARRFVRVALIRPWHLDQWWLFAWRLVELISGVTVYRFIPGSIAAEPGPLGPWGWMLNLCVFSGLIWVARAWYRHRHELTVCDRSLGYGALGSLLAFFLVAGPEAIEAHYERYGVCLLVPLCLVAARAIAWHTAFPTPGRVRLRVATLAFAWLLLGSFYWLYFRPFAITGGNSHVAFRTSPTGDPKQQALFGLTSLSRSAEAPLWIVAEDWWTEWPARYLLFHAANVHVLNLSEAQAQAETLTTAQRAGRVRWIGLMPSEASGPADRSVGHAPPGQQWLVDRSGRACVVIRDRPHRPASAAGSRLP